MPSLSEIADALKNAGQVLTITSGVGYACGYLVMRARAYALGTDPGFSLVDQAYIWAGIRLAMMLLFAVLLAAIPLLLLREAWHLLLHIGPRPAAIIECGVAVAVGAATILLASSLFGASNLIFADPHAALRTPMASAVLGRNALGTILFIGSTALAGVIVLWVRSHVARSGGVDALAVLLVVMGVLLSALLPIQHGFFFADRKVRQIDRVPEGVTGLEVPIWIVERGAGDRVVLFGRDQAGTSRLVTVTTDKIDGIAVFAVADLGDVLTEGPHR
jgi:hypothetical protein